MKWTISPAPDPDLSRALAKQLNVDLLISDLLIQRGIETYEQARTFFRPSLDDLHDPFLMKDMDKAVARLQKALSNGEKIMVYGDYDVDGTTSVALVYSFLMELGVPCDYYIPDRYTEGYGISNKGVEFAVSEGFTLMIALDCGVRAVEQVELARAGGMDMVICDHHQPGEVLPKAIALLDPQRKDCDYPYKGLSGCGVGFKLLQGFCVAENLDLDLIFKYLDLLTVSIGADIVPITGENRILASVGLKKLQNDPLPGFVSLFKMAGYNKRHITISDVVFTLAPRINAAGRITSAKNAVKVLIAKSEEEALVYSQGIEVNNKDRKGFDKAITLEALGQIRNDSWYETSKSTVVWSPEWHKGVIGIVASRLIEQYYKPTIVFTGSGKKLSGSARSVDGINVLECLEECRDCLIQFGGHRMAAGMTMTEENFLKFRERFDEAVAKRVKPEHFEKELLIDRVIELGEISASSYAILRQFGPFGPGNMKPLFLTKNVIDAKGTRAVGEDSSHLKLHVRSNTSAVPTVKGIAFKQGAQVTDIIKGRAFDIVYSLEENEWQGQVNVELNVRDMSFCTESAPTS